MAGAGAGARTAWAASSAALQAPPGLEVAVPRPASLPAPLALDAPAASPSTSFVLESAGSGREGQRREQERKEQEDTNRQLAEQIKELKHLCLSAFASATDWGSVYSAILLTLRNNITLVALRDDLTEIELLQCPPSDAVFTEASITMMALESIRKFNREFFEQYKTNPVSPQFHPIANLQLTIGRRRVLALSAGSAGLPQLGSSKVALVLCN